MNTAIKILAGMAAFVLIIKFRLQVYQILNALAVILPPGMR